MDYHPRSGSIQKENALTSDRAVRTNCASKQEINNVGSSNGNSHDQGALEVGGVGVRPIKSLPLPDQRDMHFGIVKILWIFHDVIHASTSCIRITQRTLVIDQHIMFSMKIAAVSRSRGRTWG